MPGSIYATTSSLGRRRRTVSKPLHSHRPHALSHRLHSLPARSEQSVDCEASLCSVAPAHLSQLKTPFQGHNRCECTSLSQINSSVPAKGQDFSAHLCSSEPGLCFYTGRSACSSTATLTSQGTTLPGTGDLKLLDHVDHFMFNVTPAHSHPSLSGPPKPSQPLSITTTSPSHYSHPRPWATATRLASPGSPNSPYLDPKKPEEPWFSESLLGAPRLSSAVSGPI